MKVLILAVLLTGLAFHSHAQKASAEKTENVILDNESVKVYNYESKPGKDVCGLGRHSHPAHLNVMLTDATIIVTSEAGKVQTVKLPAGSSFWSEPETHIVVNGGTGTVKMQIVEVKKKR